MNYVLEANLALCLFLLIYRLVLTRETDFGSKRLLLLGGFAAAIVLPLLSVSTALSNDSINNLVSSTLLPEVVIGQSRAGQNTPAHADHLAVVKVIYLSGLVVFLGKFLLELFALARRIRSSAPVREGAFFIGRTGKAASPFSFFRYIVFPDEGGLNEKDRTKILAHEMAHGKKYHSLDLVLVNIAIVFFWFNPALWFYKRVMVQLHEFDADSETVLRSDVNEYCSLLGRMALQSSGIKLGSPFSDTLTLKRIKMIKTNKNQIKSWRIAVIASSLPVLFFLFSCNDQVMKEVNDLAASSTVAVDVPAAILERVKVLEQKSPGEKFVVLQLNDEGEKTLGSLEDQFGLPKYMEVLTEDGPMIGQSQSGVIIQPSSMGQSGEVKFIILGFNEARQNFPTLVQQKDVYNVVEESASFPGGIEKLYQFLQTNMTYPKSARAKGIGGKVFVEFIVEPDGTVSNVVVAKGVDAALNAEAKRVIQLSPKWSPGKNEGKAVRQKMVIPVLFSTAAFGE